jgi:hypothetical protein
MSSDLIIAVVTISILIGYFGSVLYYRSTALSWAEQQWRLTGEPIHFGPVGATCYGTEPIQSYRNCAGHYGAVGILGEYFVFSTRAWERYMVPLASIIWAGVREITVAHGKGTKKVSALMVHGEFQDEYYVFALSSDERYAIEQQLSARRNLRIANLGDRSESYGPATVTRVAQDIYGEWHEEDYGQLFLAPDRLRFSHLDRPATSIFLGQIRAVGAFSRGGILNNLNPFAEDLLRIEYQPTPDGKPEVIGFVVRDGDIWAESIHVCSPARIALHTGRKKKIG